MEDKVALSSNNPAGNGDIEVETGAPSPETPVPDRGEGEAAGASSAGLPRKNQPHAAGLGQRRRARVGTAKLDAAFVLKLDESAPWERAENEPERAYQGFVVYRNLGATRNLHAAYRQWKSAKTGAAGQTSSASLHNGPFGSRIAPPANWKRWRKEYQWDARAEAYDRWNEQNDRARIEEARRRRVEERLAIEAADHERILTLRQRIAVLDSERLLTTVTKIENGRITHDAVKEYQALNKERRVLEDDYFALTEPLWSGGAEAGVPGGNESPVRIIAGSFSVGDRMYDNCDPPPLPGRIREPELPPPSPNRLLINDELTLDLTGTPYENCRPEEPPPPAPKRPGADLAGTPCERLAEAKKKEEK